MNLCMNSFQRQRSNLFEYHECVDFMYTYILSFDKENIPNNIFLVQP